MMDQAYCPITKNHVAYVQSTTPGASSAADSDHTLIYCKTCVKWYMYSDDEAYEMKLKYLQKSN